MDAKYVIVDLEWLGKLKKDLINNEIKPKEVIELLLSIPSCHSDFESELVLDIIEKEFGYNHNLKDKLESVQKLRLLRRLINETLRDRLVEPERFIFDRWVGSTNSLILVSMKDVFDWA